MSTTWTQWARVGVEDLKCIAEGTSCSQRLILHAAAQTREHLQPRVHRCI